jgi:hypothetical protein
MKYDLGNPARTKHYWIAEYGMMALEWLLPPFAKARRMDTRILIGFAIFFLLQVQPHERWWNRPTSQNLDMGHPGLAGSTGRRSAV